MATISWLCNMLERQTQAMSRMVDDLLDVSRITRGRVQLRKEEVELAAVISGAIGAIRPAIEAREQDLRVELPRQAVYLHADSFRLEQVFINLLSNASKFTPVGGHIEITAEISRSEMRSSTMGRDGEAADSSPGNGIQAVIRVKDDGAGIDQKNLPHVFDLFMQADRTLDRAPGGLGIGLTLVRSLVRMHGGAVEVYSAGIGQGSEFVVRLPVISVGARPATRKPPAEERPQPTPHPRRVLVVDDNHDAAESLALLLRLGRHEVEIAYSGPEALELVQSFDPEIVLLDLGLPGMDGFEVARRIRNIPRLQNTFIVAVSGYGREEDRRRSQESGFDYHLIKPLESEILNKILLYASESGDE